MAETDDPRVFISYVRKDKEAVEELYQKLLGVGFHPWMDTKDLLPGENWKIVLLNSIRQASVFLACLSNNSVNKRGIVQIEIKEALEVIKERFETDIFIIPIRLENCQVPDSLSRFQWVDLFEQEGFWKLVNAIREALERLRPATQKESNHNKRRKNEVAILLIDEISLNLNILKRTEAYLATSKSDIDYDSIDSIYKLVAPVAKEIYEKHFADLDSFPVDIRRLISGHYRNLDYFDMPKNLKTEIEQMKSVEMEKLSEYEKLLVKNEILSLLEGRRTALKDFIGGTEKLLRILQTQLK